MKNTLKIVFAVVVWCSCINPVTAQSTITFTNSPKAQLIWNDPNPPGAVAQFVATMVPPTGLPVLRTVPGSATNIFLSAFASSFANGLYSFNVIAVGTNTVSSPPSTNITTVILTQPTAVVNLQINFAP